MTSPVSPLRARLEQLLAEATPGQLTAELIWWKLGSTRGQPDGYWWDIGGAEGTRALVQTDGAGKDDPDAAAMAALIAEGVNALPVLLSVLRAVEELADEWERSGAGDARYATNRIATTTTARALRDCLLPASPTTEETNR